MILADDALAIYIAAGLAGFLVLLCCLSAIVCKGPCRSFNEPVKSPFEMYMDPASKSEALQYKYESYQYHLMTPKTAERRQVKVPTPLVEVTGATAGTFDFGAVLRMQAIERSNSQSKERHGKDPLLQAEQDSQSSSVSANNGGDTTVENGRVAVEIESDRGGQISTPPIVDSCV